MERKHARAQRKPALARETRIVHCRRIAMARTVRINLASLKQQRAVLHVQIPITPATAAIIAAVTGFQPQAAYIRQHAQAHDPIVPVHAIEALHHVRSVRMLQGLSAPNRELRRVIQQKQMPQNKNTTAQLQIRGNTVINSQIKQKLKKGIAGCAQKATSMKIAAIGRHAVMASKKEHAAKRA